jgi:hypothetical protein
MIREIHVQSRLVAMPHWGVDLGWTGSRYRPVSPSHRNVKTVAPKLVSRSKISRDRWRLAS